MDKKKVITIGLFAVAVGVSMIARQANADDLADAFQAYWDAPKFDWSTNTLTATQDTVPYGEGPSITSGNELSGS